MLKLLDLIQKHLWKTFLKREPEDSQTQLKQPEGQLHLI